MIISNGTANLNLTGRTLACESEGIWTGVNGSITLSGGGILSNAPNATLETDFDGSLANSAGANLFANAGLFRKINGSSGSATIIGVPIANSGTMEVQSGTLSLNGGGTSTATNLVDSGATLNISSGTPDFTTSSMITVSTNGTLQMSSPGGTAAFEGSINCDGTGYFTGGTANITGNCDFGLLQISGGTVNFNGTNSAFAGDAYMSGGVLGGSNKVIVGSQFDWAAGNITGSGPIVVFTGLSISNGSGNLNLFGRTLVNSTNGIWTGNPGGSITFANSATISNAAGAVFNAIFDGGMGNSSGANSFQNSGTFEKTGGTGSTTIGIPYVNTGTTAVQVATITLNNGSTSTGVTTVATNAAIVFAGGTHNFNAGSVTTGSGAVSVTAGVLNNLGIITSNIVDLANGATVKFNGTSTAAPSALNITNGTVGGSNTVTVTGLMKWLTGSLNGTGNLTANGGLTMGSGNANVNLFGWTLVNASNATWTGAGGGSVTFANSGQPHQQRRRDVR